MTPARLEEALRALDITQTDCADLLCVNKRTVRRWIAGDAPIPGCVEIVLKLMEAIPLTPQRVTMLVNSRE